MSSVIPRNLQVRSLLPKQQRFADVYCITSSRKEAAEKVGYSTMQATRLLADPRVKDYIANKMKRMASRYEIDGDRVMAELARVAFADPKALVENGLDIDKYTEEQRSALNIEISTGAAGTKIRHYDKVEALEKLAKILKLYPEKNVQTAVVIPGLKELLENINGADTGIGQASSRLTQETSG